jgi:NAD(P)-dependent dehydrogenase (short-subunit alcohol dehydrogenase family)
MKNLIHAVALAGLLIAAPPGVTSADEGGGQRAVLVTGASTGIGRNIAERLAAEGYFVFAGARKDKDLEELDAIDNVKAVRLDVTSQEDVDAAVETVKQEGKGLYGLINNAGVAVVGPLSQTPDSDLQFVFGVNIGGVVRITRAFAPMIIESKGRIMTTGSISGILSSPTLGVYSMSKHAVEAFTDALAGEMAEHGVSVSVIEPGNYKSKIRRTTMQRTREKMETAGVELTDEQRERFDSTAERELALKEPDEVSDAFMHALFSDAPKRRYMVVPNAEEAERTIRKAVEELVQLNDWQAYSFDRDELVKMIDEALASP